MIKLFDSVTNILFLSHYIIVNDKLISAFVKFYNTDKNKDVKPHFIIVTDYYNRISKNIFFVVDDAYYVTRYNE
ncbi:hypothetical protein Cassandra_0432 [Pseudomonas phage Cassandra]|nr:hypothetical protein Cassandra_0432 [Pseudomonas phage Cassandra]